MNTTSQTYITLIHQGIEAQLLEARATIQIAGSIDDIRNAIIGTTTKLGWSGRVVRDDLVVITTGLSAFSFGEEIILHIIQGAEFTDIHIRSKTSWQLIDWGKNRRNIDDFTRLMEIQLRTRNQVTSSFCQACKAALRGDERFCTRCGNRLNG